MKITTTTKNRWICIPLLLTGVVSLSCKNDRVQQPTVSRPYSTPSTSASTAASNSDPAPSTAAAALDRTAASETTASTTTKTTSASTGSLNDMQIVDIVKAANDAEIGAGTLAKTRAGSPHVRAYAKKMLDDHSQSNAAGKTILSQKMDASAAENQMSITLRAETAAQLTKLQSMSGSAFDQAYIDEQVRMHKQLLTDLDDRFIPAAKDAKLKNYLKETRKHVNQHLQGAQQVLSMINSGI